MSKGLLIGALCVVMCVGTSMAAQLDGYTGNPNNNPPDRVEDLFQGDLTPEMGLGCSNTAGTSGGPNDCAVGVTAGTPPPFSITSHYYNIFTQVSPTITALSFVAWGGGFEPGAEIGRQAGMNWTEGDHTAAISPAINIPSAQFYFGQNQPQSNVGMRWGLDTGISAGTSYIRAPSCGAGAWILLDALGFPGNWVFSVTVDAPTPVELHTWGSVKTLYE